MNQNIGQINSGKTFRLIDGQSILKSAETSGLNLPYSCRTGRCSTCKCKIKSGQTFLIGEETGLTASERDEGWVLSCVRSAEQNIDIDIDDFSHLKLSKPRTLPCRIDSLHYLTSDILRVVLRLPPHSNFRFLEGQYIDVIGPKATKRSYSIANKSSDTNLIELNIRKVQNGVFSHYWFQEAQKDDLLRLNGPHGTFCMDSNDEGSALVFLATGTGIAPVKAMLARIADEQTYRTQPRISVVWGNRKPEDFFWSADELRVEFSYLRALSRNDSSWLDDVGYVQDIALRRGLLSPDVKIYACGSPEMIKDARLLCSEHGVKPENFKSDAFVSSS